MFATCAWGLRKEDIIEAVFLPGVFEGQAKSVLTKCGL